MPRRSLPSDLELRRYPVADLPDDAFARAVGARPGLEMRVSELDPHADASALFGPPGTVATWCTQVGWQARDPRIAEQHDTAVLDAHRGHGLRGWLVATMLERLHRERPVARVVRTGHADANAPMLAINEALGCRIARATTVWQLDVGDASKA